MTEKKSKLFTLTDVKKLGPIGRKKLEDIGIYTKLDMITFPPLHLDRDWET